MPELTEFDFGRDKSIMMRLRSDQDFSLVMKGE